jgi:hypothetical protein
MMMARKVFNKVGRFAIDGKFVMYQVHKAVPVIFHEGTEMWACPLMFSKHEKFSWHDLRIKIMRQLCEEARGRVRLKYIAEMEAKAEAERQANMVHVDIEAKDPVDAFR